MYTRQYKEYTSRALLIQPKKKSKQSATRVFQTQKASHIKYLADNRPNTIYQRHKADLIQCKLKNIIQKKPTPTEHGANGMASAAGLFDTILGIVSTCLNLKGERRQIIPEDPGNIIIGNCKGGYVENGEIEENGKVINNGNASLKFEKITLTNKCFENESKFSFIVRKLLPPIFQFVGGGGTIASSICSWCKSDPGMAVSTIISSSGYILNNFLGLTGNPKKEINSRVFGTQNQETTSQESQNSNDQVSNLGRELP